MTAATTAARPRISVAIPTYDGRDLLDIVLPSVFAQDVAGEVEVVVVDDGSTDGTVEHLAQRWPRVRVVWQHNAGVSAAMNRCVAESRGEYIALLNNDLELAPGFLAALAGALDDHPQAGSACGKMLYFDDRTRIHGAGDLLRWSGGTWPRGHGERDDGQYDAPGEVLSPCGGAAIYRREALRDVGQFDATFVAYLEDVDWGLRAQMRGWSCRYVPQAVCFHMGSATTARAEVSDRHARLLRRNSVLLVVKDFPARALLRHWPAIVRHNAGWWTDSVRGGQGRLHLAAWLDACRALPATLRSRRTVQRGRTVPLSRLDEVISGRRAR